MNSILIATHALAFLFGGMLVALAWHANTRDTRQPKQEPPAGFDSDPMMESDDEATSAPEFRKRLGETIAADITKIVMREVMDAKPPRNSGYPLTHEETEAMLAECPQPSVVADIGLCKIPKGTFPERAEPRYDERCGCEPVPEDCKAFGINSPRNFTGD